MVAIINLIMLLISGLLLGADTPRITPHVVIVPALTTAELPDLSGNNPPVVTTASIGTAVPYPGDDAALECAANPDRFNWRPYAITAGFPEDVLPELEKVIMHESGGDLCAVNPTSGATCWIQQLPGGSAFYNPSTCMAWGYAKWVDGGHSFWRHWYQWW